LARDEASVMDLGGEGKKGVQISDNMLFGVCRSCPGHGF